MLPCFRCRPMSLRSRIRPQPRPIVRHIAEIRRGIPSGHRFQATAISRHGGPNRVVHQCGRKPDGRLSCALSPIKSGRFSRSFPPQCRRRPADKALGRNRNVNGNIRKSRRQNSALPFRNCRKPSPSTLCGLREEYVLSGRPQSCRNGFSAHRGSICPLQARARRREGWAHS